MFYFFHLFLYFTKLKMKQIIRIVIYCFIYFDILDDIYIETYEDIKIDNNKQLDNNMQLDDIKQYLFYNKIPDEIGRAHV